MHYFRAPFALFATTFVTAVLAAHINVPTRRDVNALTRELAIASESVDLVNKDIQSLSSNTPEQGFKTLISDLSTAAEKVQAAVPLVTTIGTIGPAFDEITMNIFVTLLFSLVNTTFVLAEEQGHNGNLVLFDSNELGQMLTTYVTEVHNLENAIIPVFPPDIVQQVKAASIDIDKNADSVLNFFQSGVLLPH